MPPAPITPASSAEVPAPAPAAHPATQTQHGDSAPLAATPELTTALRGLCDKLATYLEPAEVERIVAAYHFGEAAHEGQFRNSGEPYISHPLAVATSLADWHLDAQALMAALLHDVMEDTAFDKQEIAERFGKPTAELVDAVSKIGRLEGQTYEEAQAENFRKMLLAMARDVRVILIKLADRLHNIQTLGTFRPDKRRRVARETLDIYAPIANRLGLNTLSRELQELSFMNAQPMRYRVLEKALNNARGNRRESVSRISETLRRQLPEMGIEAEVMGREKHIYSIYRKMREKNLTFSQVYDIYGFRILVKDRPSCYLALGALHSIYKPVPGKIKDYIAIPKVNGYQSLHTTLIGPYGTPVEVQIRTHEMHHIAETGVASHWMYKDEQTLDEFQQKTHKWLQSLLELQTTSGTPSEFLEHVKVDLFPGEVFVFTPQGKIIGLPRGATPVDFAYAIHTDVGNRCVACRINGESKPLRTVLRNGEQVEIICAAHANPNPSWLTYVKSSRARSQIRHFLKSRQSDESADLGAHMLAKALQSFGLTLDQIDDATWERFMRGSTTQSRKEVLTDIGLGKRLPAIVARRLASGHESVASASDQPAEKRKPLAPIIIHGGEGVAMQLAKCCRPLPGDPIIGIVRKGQGLTVHTNDCRSVGRARHENDSWVEVEWDPASSGSYETSVRIVAENRRGALARMTAAIAAADSDILNLQIDADPDVYTTLQFTLLVNSRVHLARIMRSLRHLPEVARISRARD
jgi:guanosine-3',5'-bis(diphosphate) 3'-pyrophosphohydrolase